MKRRGFRLIARWVVVLSAALPVILYAQSATTALSGRVLDAQGALVQDAKVTLISESGIVRRETTGALGFFWRPASSVGLCGSH